VVWETHGASVLERLAITDPGKLAQIAYGLLRSKLLWSLARMNLIADPPGGALPG
jgi:hypothetical protein